MESHISFETIWLLHVLFAPLYFLISKYLLKTPKRELFPQTVLLSLLCFCSLVISCDGYKADKEHKEFLKEISQSINNNEFVNKGEFAFIEIESSKGTINIFRDNKHKTNFLWDKKSNKMELIEEN